MYKNGFITLEIFLIGNKDNLNLNFFRFFKRMKKTRKTLKFICLETVWF